MQIRPEAFTIVQRTQAIGSDYKPIFATTDVDVIGSVQPADEKLVVNDDGYSGQRRRRFNTKTEVREPDSVNGIPGDLVSWDGRTWVVWLVKHHRGLPGLPSHYVAHAYERQPIRPAEGSP